MTSPYTAVNEVRTTHTPGEWVYLDIGEVVVQGDIDVTIATIDYSRERAEADGALIAAAPLLLDTLRECVKQLDTIIEDGTPTDYAMWREALRTAIASAESSS